MDKDKKSIKQITPTLNSIKNALYKASIIYEVCGSVRRRCKSVSDIDIVVCRDMEYVLAALDMLEPKILDYDDVLSRIMIGSIYTDIMVSDISRWGASVFYMTGDINFNRLVSDIANHRGMRLDRNGLFKDDKCVASKFEEDIFDYMGIPFIQPWKRNMSHKTKEILKQISKETQQISHND